MARVLYVLHTFESAGSQHSMLAHAKSMRSLGHEVSFTGAHGPFEQDLQRENIPFHVRPYSAYTPLSLLGLAKLALVIKRVEPDLLHSNSYWPHIECLFMKSLFKVPVISTIAGGPFFGKPLIPDCPIISYSEELKEEIVRRCGSAYSGMLVMKNRMDVRSVPKSPPNRNVEEGRFPASVLFISRLDRDKEQSVSLFLQEIERLHTVYTRVAATILGGGEIETDVRLRALEINERLGKDVVTVTGHKKDVFPSIEESDIVVALGRSAMESMVSAKPVLIPCSDGTLSPVVRENADRHARYNLAGRLARTDEDRRLDADNLKRLFEDPGYYNQIAGFSRQYVIDNYDVMSVQGQMQALYLEEIDKAAHALSADHRLALFCECVKAYGKGSWMRLNNLAAYLKSRVMRAAAERKAVCPGEGKFIEDAAQHV